MSRVDKNVTFLKELGHWCKLRILHLHERKTLKTVILKPSLLSLFYAHYF